MRGLHSALLVLKEEKGIKVLRSSKIKSGAGGLLGTKGALSVTIFFQGLFLQIINCHLASGHGQN